jgi:hypothetical protein
MPSRDEMRQASRKLILNSQQMDLMEFAIYGDYGEVARQKAEAKAAKKSK